MMIPHVVDAEFCRMSSCCVPIFSLQGFTLSQGFTCRLRDSFYILLIDAVEVEMYIAVEIRFPNGDPKSLSQMRFRGPDADDLMLEDANPP